MIIRNMRPSRTLIDYSLLEGYAEDVLALEVLDIVRIAANEILNDSNQRQLQTLSCPRFYERPVI